MSVNPNQHDLLIGSLMGDGYMVVRSSKNTAAFRETHGPDQYGYLQWKADLLEGYTNKIGDCTKRDGDRVFHSRRLYTKMCEDLRPYYDLFYPDGKRVFPENLPELFSPFALAVWYLDDGSTMGKFHPRITFGLCEVSLERAVAALKTLGLTPTVHVDKRGCSVSIQFPSQSEHFYNLIRPHVPTCMSYKVPVDSDRRLKDRNAKKLTCEKAKELHDGGMSYTDIAKMFGVGLTTARRRVLAYGLPPKKMGRPARS
tara:strand:+ start:2019 stop:2786 length:768 start_codon:yes stop_codon:yes gene_type:complete